MNNAKILDMSEIAKRKNNSTISEHAQETHKKQRMAFLDMLFRFFIMALVLSPTIAYAIDLNTEPSAEDKAAFDNILTPVMKIYNFIKYAASAIAVIALLFAGISYMTSGSDPKKRDNAKGIATYVLIGLVIIWGAPFIVNLLIT